MCYNSLSTTDMKVGQTALLFEMNSEVADQIACG